MMNGKGDDSVQRMGGGKGGGASTRSTVYKEGGEEQTTKGASGVANEIDDMGILLCGS